MYCLYMLFYILFFFFNDTATTEIYTLSLHDALPISGGPRRRADGRGTGRRAEEARVAGLRGAAEVLRPLDRKSTRLNSSHVSISYAVFCLKKKKKIEDRHVKLLSTTNHKQKLRYLLC